MHWHCSWAQHGYVVILSGPTLAVCTANYVSVRPHPAVPSCAWPGCRLNETTVLLRGTMLERQVRYRGAVGSGIVHSQSFKMRTRMSLRTRDA